MKDRCKVIHSLFAIFIESSASDSEVEDMVPAPPAPPAAPIPAPPPQPVHQPAKSIKPAVPKKQQSKFNENFVVFINNISVSDLKPTSF